MNLAPSEAAAFASAFLAEGPSLPARVDVAIAPPFPSLERVGRLLVLTDVRLAAQDVHGEPSGPFTGEVSAAMLADLGVALVLVGHSERRRGRGETEAVLEKKLRRAAEAGLSPVYCVGETLEERERGETEEVLARQLAALDGFSDPPEGLAIAYEPVWAIGTGRNATPRLASEVHARIRERLARRFGDAAATATRILYGGSVTAENAAELTAGEGVDGALVGGASLDPGAFAALVRAVGGAKGPG